MEATLDLRLIPALHALLEEASVTRAAQRLGVTVPTMSRTLARLREQFGDPLLVRAGRELVRTPRAEQLRDGLGSLLIQAEALLRPELESRSRILCIRAADAAIGAWAWPVLERLRGRAPNLRLSFVGEGDERPEALRDGSVHLDIGVLDHAAPELRSQVLLRDRYVGVVRVGHPLSRRSVTVARLGKYEHVGVSRRGRFEGPIDEALASVGAVRSVVTTVPSFYAALFMVAQSDLVTAVPRRLVDELGPMLGLATFRFPFALPEVGIAQTWHPRFDADPAHRLLRESVLTCIRSGRSSSSR